MPVDGQVIAGPGVQWMAEHWYDDNGTIIQDDSGEDWYYDFKPYLNETDDFVGYIAAGFSDVVNETLPGALCVNCGENDTLCYFFETGDHQLGCARPKLSEFDLLGEVEWYSLYGPENAHGFLRSVVQTETGYVAVGQITYEGGAGIPYNYHVPPGTGAPLAECSEEEPAPYTLLYLVQTNMEGEDPVERVYGWAAPGDAGLYTSEGYQILEDIDGSGFLIIGITEVDIERVDAPSGFLTRAWVIKVDEDLEIEWQQTYELSLPTAVDPVPWSTAYCGIEIGDYYYVGCTQVLENDFDESLIHIIKIDKADGDLVTDYVINDSRDPDCLTPISPYTVAHNRAFELIENSGDILVAASTQRNKWWGDTEVKGMATVYRIDIGVTPTWSLDVIPVTEAGTFDLKTGITNTSDGGFAVTTTVHAGDLDLSPIPYPKEYVDGETCYFNYESSDKVNLAYWNADTYVAKFDASDDMQWEQTYPTTTEPYDELVMFPDDIKRMECMYHIVEAPDGGLAIAGNNSKNFDDDLVIKLYSDCNRYVTYNTGSGDINVTGTYTISTDVTWNANKKVRGIIEIEDDATLTINNSAIIQFADSKADAIPTYIRVKRGGRLVIEGGAKLTGNTECGTMWEGIYVEGTYGTNHPTPASLLTAGYFVTGDAHGLVKISGDATIEYARNGVTLGLPIEMDDYPDYGGGILIADNGNFLNNTIDVMMWPFDKNNVSFIRHCDFSTTTTLPDPVEIPEAHIKMIQVKNVNIRGNVFENTTAGTVYAVANRGMGILGYNATFKANDNPNGFAATGGTGSDPNYFNDLYYGVYAAQFTTLSSNILVNGNVFSDNYNGIYVGGATLPEVNFNTITIPLKMINNYGIYIDGCDGYGVEENNLTGAGANLLGTQIGIVVNESGTGSNWIYRNNFSALKYGVRMQGNNGDTDDGLEIKCNTFEEGKYDISLISGATTATMKKDQGACGTLTSPASNLLTDPNFSEYNYHFKTSIDINTADFYKYSFHEDEDIFDSPFAAPDNVSTSIDPKPDGLGGTGCNDFNLVDDNLEFQDYCPTNFPSGSGGSGRMAAPKAANRRPPSLMMPLTYNPYEYLKPAGVAYEAFLGNIRFNIDASYYMQNALMDSLKILLNENNSPLATSIKIQLLEDSSAYENAELLSAELTESPDAELNGYNSSILSIALSLSRDTLTWLQATEEQFSAIMTEAQRNDREGIQAKLLMELIARDAYEEPINELNEELTIEELKLFQQNLPQSELNSIQIYPHPVASGSVVEINLESIQSNTRFIIADAQGRPVLQFPLDSSVSYIKIDNTMLKPGVYIGYVSGAPIEQVGKQIVVIQ